MALTRTQQPSIAYLRECFEFDADTGVLRWRARPMHHFNGPHGHRTTNGRSAGKVAGSPSSKGYLQVEINGVSFKAHRIVFALVSGGWPAGEIDHINGNPQDNRPLNLRQVEGFENMANKGMYARNRTGEPNISYRAEPHLHARWHVQIVAKGVKHQAYFRSLDDAKQWRDAKRIELGFHPNHGRRPGYPLARGASK